MIARMTNFGRSNVSNSVYSLCSLTGRGFGSRGESDLCEFVVDVIREPLVAVESGLLLVVLNHYLQKHNKKHSIGGYSLVYSSDIIKSNKRQISKSNISKTAAILKPDERESFLDFYLVYKYVCLKILR